MLGRILFVTSRFGGLPQGMINSLNKMGVDYKQVPIWSMKDSFVEFQPQVMIFFHHFLKEWTPELLDQIGSIQCHKILWSWEDPWEIDYIAEMHHVFSHVLSQDRNSVRWLETKMSNKAVHVPHAADQEHAKPPVEIPFEYRSDLCFIGAAYPSRLKFFRDVLPHLSQYKVVIGGTGWEFLPNINGQKIINKGVGEQEYFKYVCGAKIVLNLHRESLEVTIANNTKVQASSPNNRLFEIFASNSFQMVDDKRMPEMGEYYPGIETFHDAQDFLPRFDYWMKHDDERRQYAYDKYTHTLRHHTYENRFIEIISGLI